jgi:antitoxin component YwqK of YwqJK toxin-antitoxin module
MRKLSLLPALCVSIVFASCGHSANDNSAKSKSDSTAKSDSAIHKKLVIGLASDTNRHNYTDDKGKRQGYWMIRNVDMSLPGYDSNAKVEEGVYKDGMKEGEWIEYNANGSIKSTTTFKNNQPVN